MPDSAGRYVEAIASVAPADADAAAAILRSLADSGTWTEQPFTQPTLESGAILLSEATARIHVYFRGDDASANASLARAALRAADISAAIEVRGVDAEDWAESWKEHFHVERYGRRLVVVPSWCEHAAAADDIVITIDPGMAFGTGQHETTRMCLEALEDAVRPGARVLDVGCGSGILSVAAAKLRASSVLALDIDPDCTRITTENARLNGVDGIIDARHGTLDASFATDQVEVVVANIIAGVLVELAPALAAATSAGGVLIASGVIGERADEVTRAFEAAGLRMRSTRAMGEWRCIVAEHAPEAAS